MKTRLSLALLAVLGAAGAAPADDDPEPPPDARTMLRKLAGTYEVIQYEYNGTLWEAAERRKMKVVLNARGDDEFHFAGGFTSSKCTLMPNKKRGEIDSTYTNGPARGQTVKGIYKVEGDLLIYCYAAVRQERPTRFEAKANSGATLYTLRRLKAK